MPLQALPQHGGFYPLWSVEPQWNQGGWRTQSQFLPGRHRMRSRYICQSPLCWEFIAVPIRVTGVKDAVKVLSQKPVLRLWGGLYRYKRSPEGPVCWGFQTSAPYALILSCSDNLSVRFLVPAKWEIPKRASGWWGVEGGSSSRTCISIQDVEKDTVVLNLIQNTVPVAYHNLWELENN